MNNANVQLVYRAQPTDDAAPARRQLPRTPRHLRLGMPHLDVGGLSENWLFRHAGELHWEEISRRLGVASDEIRAEQDERLYPTVVALRARYEAPLAAVGENDVLDAFVQVEPCGGACAHGIVAAQVRERRFHVELLTTFALRHSGSAALRMALPAARLSARWRPVAVEPELVRRAKAARRGTPLADEFWGATANPAALSPLGQVSYEPSPYSDYNGAGLLYFASYATIADTAERQLVRRLGLDRPGFGGPQASPDWALATSPTARDVFFYGNLPLGESLIAELLEFAPRWPAGPRLDGGSAEVNIRTRVRLRRENGGQPMADIITNRVVVTPARRGRLEAPSGLPRSESPRSESPRSESQ
jgi:probable biosynthetic protein (TIGR04098 family)